MKYIRMYSLYLLNLIAALLITGLSSAKTYSILDYGAIPDGKSLSTRAIQSAIDDCAQKGGGVVEFPAGRFVSGTFYMKSFVTLHLASGAILAGSKNLDDYPVTISKIRSYTDNYTCRSLIYGENTEHTGITGDGVIDGNGGSFQVSGERVRKDLFESYKARPYLIRFINCRNIRIQDITLKDSPMWVQHYLVCSNLVISGITVKSKVNSNNDGIDIDACNDVRISDCSISSGDDAIVLKSTCDRICRNVTVTNCVLNSDCNAFKLGTESNGGFQNICFSNSVIHHTRLAGIALETVDGGITENVTVSGINMDSVECAIFVRLGNRARPYRENMAKPPMGKLSNIMISGIQATNVGNTGCSITGLPSFPVERISLRDIRLQFRGGGTGDLVNRPVEELPEKYPEYNMFGKLPAYGFFCRHVTQIEMDNVSFSCKTPEYRPALFLSDLTDSRISDLDAWVEDKTESVTIIDSSTRIVFRDCTASVKPVTFAQIRNGCRKIGFVNMNLFRTGELFKTDKTIQKGEVISE